MRQIDFGAYGDVGVAKKRAARVGGITWLIIGVDHCLRESISCCLYIVSLGLLLKFYYDLDLYYYSGKFTLKVKEPIGMLLSS